MAHNRTGAAITRTSSQALITVSDIEGLPSAVRAQWPDVSVLPADTITRASKYLTFVTRHDPKTPATVDGFVLLESRALRNLVGEGLSVTAVEIKHSPTRGLCIRAIAGHTAVLDLTRHLPLMRHDEAIRRSIALHCTTWVSGLDGWQAYSHPLDHLPA